MNHSRKAPKIRWNASKSWNYSMKHQRNLKLFDEIPEIIVWNTRETRSYSMKITREAGFCFVCKTFPCRVAQICFVFFSRVNGLFWRFCLLDAHYRMALHRSAAVIVNKIVNIENYGKSRSHFKMVFVRKKGCEAFNLRLCAFKRKLSFKKTG